MSTLHLVSHTHWDREWYRTFQQFRIKLVHLMDRLLDILDHDAGYQSFLLDGQAIILEDYLQIRPERASDILRYIKNGRIFIGPWYISPDEFLVSPESHLRNLEEGLLLCQEYSGRMLVGYLPDTFGHIGQMPQVLRGFGIDTACVWRGLDDQPLELSWQSPDGSSVFLSYLRNGYGNAANLSTDDPVRFIAEVDELSHSLSVFTTTGNILLMHGMDHMEPSGDLTAALHAYQHQPSRDDLLHSNLPTYFDITRSQVSSASIELPVVSGELRSSRRTPLLPGVLSARMRLKQRNHACETELIKWVEPLYAWSCLLGKEQLDPGGDHSSQNNAYLEDQAALIRHAWKLLMQCHPHDSICGSSIDQVVREMSLRFDQVDQISHELTAQNIHQICEHIDTTFKIAANQPPPDQEIISSILVFNPNDQPQTGIVSLNIRLENRFSSFEIIDGQNVSLPYDQKGMGLSELISMTMDKKGMVQSLGMIHDGSFAGMVIRDFDIQSEGTRAVIRATISDHGVVNFTRWKQGVEELEALFADSNVNEFIIHAYSDPEVDLSFVAQDVPAHGYRCYWIRGYLQIGAKSPAPRKLSPFLRWLLPLANFLARVPILTRLLQPKRRLPVRKSGRIENEYFTVDVNRQDGTLSITDKRTSLVFHGLNRFVDGADCGDLYNYSPPEQDWVVLPRFSGAEREVHSSCQKLIIHSKIRLPARLSSDRKSRSRELLEHAITSTISLVPGVPRIDIHTELNNHACDHRIKVHFPAPFTCSTAFHDGHFEVVERPIGIPGFDETWEEQPRPEVPQRQFSFITDGHASLTIANRGLPEVEAVKNFDGTTGLALTLLRCVGWLSRDDFSTRKGHAGPMGLATPDAQMIGSHSFDYSIIPGGTDVTSSIHQSIAFNAPLKAINEPIHPGSLPSTQSMLEISNPNFIVTAIRSGDTGAGLVVRGFNRLPERINVTIKLAQYFKEARLINFLGDELEPVPVAPPGQVNLHIAKHKIVTLSFSE